MGSKGTLTREAHPPNSTQGRTHAVYSDKAASLLGPPSHQPPAHTWPAASPGQVFLPLRLSLSGRHEREAGVPPGELRSSGAQHGG